MDFVDGCSNDILIFGKLIFLWLK